MNFSGKASPNSSNSTATETSWATVAPVGPSSVQANPAPSGERRCETARPGASILVVEDDPRSARLVGAYLQGAGYRVSIVHSGTEAQQSVEDKLPDLVLCDVCLPDLDGIQFTRWARERFSSANLPIALITSSTDTKILSRGLAVGADDFLSKPINSLELCTRVRSLLRSKMLLDDLRQRDRAASPAETNPASRPELRPTASNPDQRTSVAIIEDNPLELRLLEAHLAGMQCDVRGATGATSGLALVRETLPDLIVVDLLLPDFSGYELISSIKADAACANIPILVVSAMSKVADRVKALELGADDFIVKGFDRLEFEARVRRLVRLKESLDRLNTRCDRALRLSVTDSLTGAFTRGFMHETLRSQLSLAQRYGHPYSIIFIDIDHFKQVNDHHGHSAGDAVLRVVAKRLRELARPSDTVARYGGEEFVVLLPQTDQEGARVLAECMREQIAALKIPVDSGLWLQVTMCLGIASYPLDATEPETLVQQADAAMYVAKQSGRNCVVVSRGDSIGQTPLESGA